MAEQVVVWKPHPKQSEFLSASEFEVLYGGSAGSGKGLALDTPLPTPNGWILMSDLKVGHSLFDDKGAVCQVTGLSEISHRPCYRLTFDDGSSIVADDVHRWVTFSVKELRQLLARDPAWKAARRTKRPSRATGKRSERFTATIAALNSLRADRLEQLPLPQGSLRDTSELVNTLRLTSGRANHAIPVANPLDLPSAELLVPPYTLGAWLGDGSSRNGQLTGADPEIWERIESEGFEVRHYSWNKQAHSIIGLAKGLRLMSVLNNKHIPAQYLRGSHSQRLALLQGLMDTDGYVGLKGACEFTSTRQCLADGVIELLASLGIKSRKREGLAKLNGRVTGPKWRVHFTTSISVFGLTRKMDRMPKQTRQVTRFRYLVDCAPVESVATKCISVDSTSRQYLCGKAMIPTHNTDGILIDALGLQQAAISKRNYQAIIFRRTFPDLKDLIDRAQQIYPDVAPGAKYDKTMHVWTFPSGARLEFGHGQYEADRFKFRGRAFQYVGFEELTLWPTPTFYEYLITRVRTSDPTIKCYVRANTNPDGPGAKWVKDRWQIPVNGTATRVTLDLTDPETHVTTQRIRRFIPGRLADNPSLANSGYRETLLMMDADTQGALLQGRWEPLPVKGAYYIKEIEEARAEGRICKLIYNKAVPVNTFWDLGANDTTAIWFHQYVNRQHLFINFYEANGEAIQHYVQHMLGLGYVFGTHYLPHDAEHRRQGMTDNRSQLEMFQELMPGHEFEVVPRIQDVKVGIQLTRQVFNECLFDEKSCGEGIAALENYRKEFDERMQTYKPTPFHDWASNGADAFRQFAQGYRNRIKTVEQASWKSRLKSHKSTKKHPMAA